MNKDTVAGKVEQVKGQIKQKVGEATGNQRLANSGTLDEVKGAARETWGKTRDAAHDVADSKRAEVNADTAQAKATQEAKANDIRAKVASTAQNVKENISEKIDEFKERHTHNG